MRTEELVEYLALGEKDASDLLDELNPNLNSRFQRACHSLAKIVDEIREVYPDANIYLSDEVLSLTLGFAFNGNTADDYYQYSNSQLVVCESHKLLGKIDSGDW